MEKLKACQVLYSPKDEKYDEKIRIFQGCPTIAVTNQGRIFAGWYAGGLREPSLDNYNVLCYSDDGGETFNKNYLVIPSEKERLVQALDIQLFVSPENKLYVFWVQNDVKHYTQVEGATEGMFGEDYIYNDVVHAAFYVVCDDPDAAEPKFSAPVYLDRGFLRCKPTVLKSGRWLLFNYDQQSDRYGYTVTDDRLKSFRRMYGGKKIATPFDEAMAYQRDDGSIRMLARTSTGKTAQSISYDDGETWTDGTETEIFNSNTRLYVEKTKSGKVLLVNNEAVGRKDMCLLLSEDDGETFRYKKLIDDRNSLSYPDVAEFNGRYYLVYDRERTGASEIIMCSFTEEDIINDNEISLRIISKPIKKEIL